jgi:hypothetical protein
MAYFSNGTDGMVLDDECSTCLIGKDPEQLCPILFVQIENNYNAVNNEVATNILNHLIDNNGKCAMKEIITEKSLITKGLSTCCGFVKEEAVICSRCKTIIL